MIKRATLIGVVLTAIGCQGSDPPTNAGTNQPAIVRLVAVEKPRSSLTTDVALLIRKGGQPITVGYPPDRAFQMYRDPKQTPFEYDQLPPRFQWPYQARSWEQAHNGFGEITYDGELVGAMYTEDSTDPSRVDDLKQILTDQMENMAPQTILGKHVTFYFWEKESQRLMICAYQVSPDLTKITVAMGDDVVMDGIGASQVNALQDQRQVDILTSRSDAARAAQIQGPG